MEKLKKFIADFPSKHLLKVVKTITMLGMMKNTYNYALGVFHHDMVSAMIVVVVIDITAIAMMFNESLSKKQRVFYIFCLLIITGLINLAHSSKDNILEIVIAVVSLVNLFVLVYIDIFLKKPDISKENFNRDLEKHISTIEFQRRENENLKAIIEAKKTEIEKQKQENTFQMSEKDRLIKEKDDCILGLTELVSVAEKRLSQEKDKQTVITEEPPKRRGRPSSLK